jgi:hypothetical protein
MVLKGKVDWPENLTTCYGVRSNFSGDVDSRVRSACPDRLRSPGEFRSIQNLLLAEIKPDASLVDSSHKKRGDPAGLRFGTTLALNFIEFLKEKQI